MKNQTILLLIASFLFSCSKEKSLINKEVTIDALPQFAVSVARMALSSKILKREVSFTAANPSLKSVRLFSYDDTKRCTEIKIGTIDSSIASPVFTLKQTLTFQYDGSSIVPSSFSSVKNIFPDITTVFYYKYNTGGRKIMDSVRVKNMSGSPSDRVIHYLYEKDQVYITPVLKGFPMENNSLDTLSLLSGGNIEKLVSRVIKSTGDRIVNYTFKYDQSFSPYNKLNIANSLYFESASLGIGYNVPLETHYMGVTTNNMTSWTADTYTVVFKYVYDLDNYPIKKEMFLPTNANAQQIIFFEY